MDLSPGCFRCKLQDVDESPITNDAIEAFANEVAQAFRRVRTRAPKHVRQQVQQVFAEVHEEMEASEVSIPGRIALVRKLESLNGELRGREVFVPSFYSEGRLGISYYWDPITIKEAVDDRRVSAHMRRYVERIDRAERRTHWFLVRAGVSVSPPPKRKPWEAAYGGFDEYRELIWGRVSRSV
jgi:hypothetical protein